MAGFQVIHNYWIAYVMNPYLNEIYKNLPRILASIDVESISPTYGVADRLYTSWKTIDYANATNQSVVHGLARLIKHQCLPDFLTEEQARRYIDILFEGVHRITRKNGSLEEAFPFEGSYCVTALVAFDLLNAAMLLDLKDKNDVIAPLIRFLGKQQETHAFISNHLATAAAALIKWGKWTNDSASISQGESILTSILVRQSDEGWYLEYEGADPGYQTLCLYYLSDIYQAQPSDELKESLEKSFKFLQYFVHPDGSFGGYYGSRNTRFYYPAAFHTLAKEIPEAKVIAAAMEQSVSKQQTVTLSAIDMPNFAPFFNAYAIAATNDIPMLKKKEASMLPCRQTESFRKHFKAAGLWINATKEAYTIVSTHKGGVFSNYDKKTKTRNINTGPLLEKSGQYYGIQHYSPNNKLTLEEESITVESQFTQIHQGLPSPFQFMVLRALSLTVFQSLTLGRAFKKLIVHMLITGKKSITVHNKRVISFDKEFTYHDAQTGNQQQYKQLDCQHPVKAIHMASAGYWEAQDYPTP
jgi:hypothetical protein